MTFSLRIKQKDKYYEIEERQTSDGWKYWLINEESEGTTVSEDNLFEVIDEFFKDNF